MNNQTEQCLDNHTQSIVEVYKRTPIMILIK